MKKVLFILLTFIMLSCNSDNDGTNSLTDPTSLNLVTGLNCRQNFDDPAFQLGNPNILVNNHFVIYPNPANAAFYILAPQNVTDVWIVPANPEKIHQELNFGGLLNTSLYSEQSINSNATFSLNGQSSNTVGVNVESLPKGYYRVFVKVNGQIYWDNLFKYGNQGTNTEQFAEINNFWN